MIKYEGIKELDNQNNGYNLDRRHQQIIHRMYLVDEYEDLKKAHTETVVSTMEDFRNKEKFIVLIVIFKGEKCRIQILYHYNKQIII